MPEARASVSIAVIDPKKTTRNLFDHALRALQGDDMAARLTRLPERRDWSPQQAPVFRATAGDLRSVAETHRVREHDLLHKLPSMSRDAIRHFLVNYQVNSQWYGTHLAALHKRLPPTLARYLEPVILDEFGAGDSEKAHPRLFNRCLRSLAGGPRIVIIEEAMDLLVRKVRWSRLASLPMGLGAFACLEAAMPRQAELLYLGLLQWGLPQDDLVFFDIHRVVDTAHGEAVLQCLSELVAGDQDVEDAVRGGLEALETRARFFDGVLRTVR